MVGLLMMVQSNAQGILDTLAPQNVDTVLVTQAKPLIKGYTKRSYVKDSLQLSILHDSLEKKWTFDDTLPPKRPEQISFPKWKNSEIGQNNYKPILLTILFFLITGLYVLKSAIYKGKTKMEYRAVLLNIYYREWIQEQQDTLTFYVVFSKTISLLLVGLFFSYLAFRLDVQVFELQWVTSMAIFLIPFILVCIKYIGAAALSYLFADTEMFRHHFSYNQIIDNFFFVPLYLSFLLAYFMIGVWDVKIFVVLGLAILLISRLVSTLFFIFHTLFNRQYKKLYVIFYLCSLEIMPTVILIRWIAKYYT
jgi:hypothetical protein